MKTRKNVTTEKKLKKLTLKNWEMCKKKGWKAGGINKSSEKLTQCLQGPRDRDKVVGKTNTLSAGST